MGKSLPDACWVIPLFWLSSHHHLEQLSWVEKTTFNFIPNPWVIFSSPHAGDQGRCPAAAGDGGLPARRRGIYTLNGSRAEAESETLFSESKGASLHEAVEPSLQSKRPLLSNSCCSQPQHRVNCFNRLLFRLVHHCNKDVLRSQMATRHFWSVHFSLFLKPALRSWRLPQHICFH